MRPLTGLVTLALVLVEIVLLVQVASVIGGLATFGLVLATGLIGTTLMRREGRRTWDELRAAVQQNRTPDRDLTDTALVLAGGALLVVPGFLTDLIGLLLVLPFTRPAARGIGRRMLGQRIPAMSRAGWVPGPAGAGATAGPAADGGPVVVQGEVIENSDQSVRRRADTHGDVEPKP